MSRIRQIIAIGLVGGLAACSSMNSTNAVSRGAPADQSVARAESATWTVRDVQVRVPDTLRVSEANVYYPIADIVWRGDILGDRREQVRQILDDAVTAGVANLDGDRPVTVIVEVKRFHSLTEKTRYSFGGSHTIKFFLSVVDARTEEVLREPRLINASLEAYGGQKAIEADLRGETQKVRITEHVAELMRRHFNPTLDDV